MPGRLNLSRDWAPVGTTEAIIRDRRLGFNGGDSTHGASRRTRNPVQKLECLELRPEGAVHLVPNLGRTVEWRRVSLAAGGTMGVGP
jgi:hypothetical protein